MLRGAGSWARAAVLLLAGCGGEGSGAPPGPLEDLGSPEDPGGSGTSGPAGADARAAWDLAFATRIELPTPGAPEGVACADFDGDGRDELIAVTREPGALLCWTDAGPAPRVIPIPDWPLPPQIVRIPGRGPLVCVATRDEPALLLFDPLAPDAEVPRRHYPLPAAPRALGVGHLAGQGPTLAVALRDGTGLVIERDVLIPFALVDALPTVIAVEADGLWIGSQDTQRVVHYERAGDTFVPRAGGAIAFGGIPRALARLELEDGTTTRLLAGGARALWIGDEKRSLGAIPMALDTGAPAGAWAALAFHELRYHRFQDREERSQGYAGQDPRDIACGDLDGDGHMDLAFANRAAHRVSVLRGAAQGALEDAPRVPVGRAPHAVTSADLNGDGSPELLCVSSLADELDVLERRADGSFAVRARLDVAPAGDRVAVGDLDGDGHLDVAVLIGVAGGVELRAWRGDGSGALTRNASWPDVRVGARIGDLVLEDLDGDGRDEAWVADPEGGVARVVVGEAAGTQRLAIEGSPRALTRLQLEPGAGPELALAVAGAEGIRGVSLLREDAEGRIERRQHIATSLHPVDVARTDADGDGRDELALLALPVLGDGPGRAVLLRRAPDGEWNEVARETTGLRPFAIACGDRDGDGRDEVFVSAQNSHHVNAWRVGQGRLVRLPDLGAGRGVLDLTTCDLNGDGALDLVVANGFSDDLSLILARP